MDKNLRIQLWFKKWKYFNTSKILSFIIYKYDRFYIVKIFKSLVSMTFFIYNQEYDIK